jgi:hypothetical protein
MQASAFWNHCALKKKELIDIHSARRRQFEQGGDETIFQGQNPSGESWYLVSREILDVQLAGRVVLMNLRLASQRIIEATHEIASHDQIKRYLSECETHRLYVIEAERRLSGRISVTVQATEPKPRVEAR